MTNADPDRQELIRLRKLLIGSFNLEELRLLCFDLGLDYEELAGRTKSTKMQDLITYLQRRGELQRLLDEVKSQRPNVDWPDFAPTVKNTVAEEKRGHEAIPDDQVSDDESEEDTAADTSIDEKTGLEMILIPAGDFIYSGKGKFVDLPNFWISRTPVTNSHYLPFVRASKRDLPEHWNGMLPSAELSDHPVDHVSWHDAKAYADWAAMDLPTEEEWEKAARGTDGRIYPWGNEWRDGYCNTFEMGIGATTPVGQYSPQGDSPYGCVDMAGNVWEWTASWHDDEKTQRVLRGGSWFLNQDNARTASRSYPFQPTVRNFDFGFRVVRHAPPE